jgi:lipopolysaccharide transport system ATP-binding protein
MPCSAPTDAPRAAIVARDVGKSYDLFDRPSDRLKQLLWGRLKSYGKTYWALQSVNFTIAPGEVVGIVGRNGAGKSTLLHMVCGTLPASTGFLQTHGRIAALLELGGGFNPHFTGLENIYLNAAILGMRREEVEDRLEDILSFADIGDFVHQPVKTYSSGMFMRLAFSVATSVHPDILVIDEALSVGDGAFARKSFDRIMRMRDAGKTILFCSHSMYQVEALCSRALWLDRGTLRMDDQATKVTSAYANALNQQVGSGADSTDPTRLQPEGIAAQPGSGHLRRAYGTVDGGAPGTHLHARSRNSDIELTIEFAIDPSLPTPSVAVGVSDVNGQTISSAGSHNDGVMLRMDARGYGSARLRMPRLPLLKGRYLVTCFLASEDALHIYDHAMHCITIDVVQSGLEQGIVSLPHEWVA